MDLMANQLNPSLVVEVVGIFQQVTGAIEQTSPTKKQNKDKEKNSQRKE